MRRVPNLTPARDTGYEPLSKALIDHGQAVGHRGPKGKPEGKPEGRLPLALCCVLIATYGISPCIPTVTVFDFKWRKTEYEAPR